MKNLTKSFLKTILPLKIRGKIRAIQYKLLGLDYEYKGKGIEEVFDSIYRDRVWGNNEEGEPISGSGSHKLEIVGPYVEKVLLLLRELKCSTVVDLGCGDFSVGKNIVDKCSSYIACDISSVILERNRRNYRSSNLSFRKIDLASDELPKGDIAFVRQVLQHMSNDNIKSFVNRINRSKPYRYLLVTEHLPSKRPFVANLDKTSGPNIRVGIGSGVVIDEPPFDLNFKYRDIILEMDEGSGEEGGRDTVIRSTLYGL